MKLLNNIYKSEKNIYIILFLIALVVAFSSSYNPFNFRIMYVDSSVYITFAQGIIRGQLPYLDLVDNKGPLLYLLSVPGLFLAGFTGIWITEILLLFVSVFFAYKTALLFGNRFHALMGTIFSFTALLAFFLVNAGTEEYSLPFLIISLYIFSKYYFSDNKNIKFIELIILGACFSCAIMIRLNMFPLWVGFCIVIFIESIFKKQFFILLKYISGFLIGILLILIPLFLYLKLNGIFEAFTEQVIFAGANRGFGGSSLKLLEKNFWLVLNRNHCYIPLLFGIFSLILKYKKNEFFFYLGYTISYFLMVLFLAFSSGGVHYNLVLIPFFIPVLTYLIRIIHNIFIKENIKYPVFLIIFFFCCMFAEGIVRYTYYITNKIYDNSKYNLFNAGKLIDNNTKPGDKIISLGINGYIYPFTQREIASKYFYQGSGINHIQGSKEEFISDILTTKPSIIVTVTMDNRNEILYDWHSPIMELIYNEYQLLSAQYGFLIYIRESLN
ncbi:MAG: hypothetical protein FWD47_00970 [Treponema sp.]|nr:hypothetical protein [Treponema sp.]